MSKFSDADFERQEYFDFLDQKTLAKIYKSMIWSTETWGGDRCIECGLIVPPRCQSNLSGWYENNHERKTGFFQAYNKACDSNLFFGTCPGENPSWMIEYTD
jgi:hypothetical protein